VISWSVNPAFDCWDGQAELRDAADDSTVVAEAFAHHDASFGNLVTPEIWRMLRLRVLITVITRLNWLSNLPHSAAG